jgi:hypothetical protein
VSVLNVSLSSCQKKKKKKETVARFWRLPCWEDEEEIQKWGNMGFRT